jgi:hypothetical protein
MATPERAPPGRVSARDARMELLAGAARMLRRVPAWPGEPVEAAVPDEGGGMELYVQLRRLTRAGGPAGTSATADPRRLLDYFLSPLARLALTHLERREPLPAANLAGLCGQLDAARAPRPAFAAVLRDLADRGVVRDGAEGYAIADDFRPLLPAVLGTADGG